jgi:hypothetical protein
MISIKKRPYIEIGGKERKKPKGIALKIPVEIRFYGATPAEISALIDFYNDTNGDSWTNNSGWKTDPYVGNWHGVTVSGGAVIKIALASNNLSGDVDITSTFSSLDVLTLQGNPLVSDISITADSITELRMSAMNISTLDVSDLVNLEYLDFQINNLTSIDLSSLTKLITLIGNGNDITTFGDLSNLNDLATFKGGWNDMPGFDYSDHPDLIFAGCQSNAMSQAEVDATILSIYNARASYTYATPELNIGSTNAAPSATGLGHIQELVYDPGLEGFNTWSVTYTEPAYTGATQDEIDALINFYYATGGPYWTTNTNWITATDVSTWHGITTSGGHVTAISLIANGLTGSTGTTLNDLTWLTTLHCQVNSLTSIDVSTNVNLTSLQVNSNSLTALDVSANVDLITLFCNSNSITSIDVSTNVDLVTFRCHTNLLTSLDVSANVLLTHLPCHTNLLASLDVSACIALQAFECQNNSMSQTAIDNLVGGIYAARNNYTFVGPIVADIGGTNSDPSGTYQYVPDPSTGSGEEQRYALENDDDTEGFTLWTLDIT